MDILPLRPTNVPAIIAQFCDAVELVQTCRVAEARALASDSQGGAPVPSDEELPSKYEALRRLRALELRAVWALEQVGLSLSGQERVDRILELVELIDRAHNASAGREPSLCSKLYPAMLMLRDQLAALRALVRVDSPVPSALTEREKQVWEMLSDKPLPASAIASKFLSSQGAYARNLVRAIRGKGYAIEYVRGCGYRRGASSKV
jgi:hypothetical protein